ncbi:hypothetical protein [Methylorubrum extorquens]|uniref:hypothetical protein n=1 Tax=Methylorubrum extorquens TaxID=408 RepID=UPI001EE5B7A6|nr:hypothetical protein [Methylorubrum extorquens]MCG5246928.1 hypothetical protein [Methylorubrum extorquens]
MTRALFSLGYQEAAQFRGLLELGADHFVCAPNNGADFFAQVGGAQNKGAWDSLCIKQGYLDTTSRNVMDEASNRSVFVQRDQTLIVYANARLRPAVLSVSHFRAPLTVNQSSKTRNNGRNESLNLSGSMRSFVPEATRPTPGGLAEGQR